MASSYAWALASEKIFTENGARGKPKRDSGGSEASGSGSGAENGQKCLQNDIFGLNTARNGAGSGENGLETTKCAKNAKNGVWATAVRLFTCWDGTTASHANGCGRDAL